MKIAIVGVGNILLQDEGVGVRVVQQLESAYSFPPGIALIDGGTAGPHLLDIFTDYEDIIIIDAVKGGQKAGTIYMFSPEHISGDMTISMSIHQMGVLEVLHQARMLGKDPEVTFIGIEPQDISPWGMELSPVIEQKVPEVIEVILKELSQRKLQGCIEKKDHMNP